MKTKLPQMIHKDLNKNVRKLSAAHLQNKPQAIGPTPGEI
jgi:hypothetical protein